MEIGITDPSEIHVPPEEVRIRELRVEAWTDGRRLAVYLEVDPFLKRPNADLVVTDQLGSEVATVSIIESMDRKMELTMHLRGAETHRKLLMTVTLYYAFIEDPESPGGEIRTSERLVVDTRQEEFEWAQ